MLHRNPPRLGEDDWFDKLTAEGRDHVRAAYMARLHAFTNEPLPERGTASAPEAQARRFDRPRRRQRVR